MCPIHSGEARLRLLEDTNMLDKQIHGLGRTLCPINQMQKSHGPTLYAFYLRDTSALSDFECGENGLIYIGAAKRSLSVSDHFLYSHSGKSELRRLLGALLKDELKLDPMPWEGDPGQGINFRFPEVGELKLTSWMQENLLACQIEISGNLRKILAESRKRLQPPLNLSVGTGPQQERVQAARAIRTNLVLESPDSYEDEMCISYHLAQALEGKRHAIEQIWKALASLDLYNDCHDDVRWLRHVAKRIVSDVINIPVRETSLRGSRALRAIGLDGPSDPDHDLREAIFCLDVFSNEGDPPMTRRQELQDLRQEGFLENVVNDRAAMKRIDRAKNSKRP
jgi:hypothetical protein